MTYMILRFALLAIIAVLALSRPSLGQVPGYPPANIGGLFDSAGGEFVAGLGGHLGEDNGGWLGTFGYRWPERIGVEADFSAFYAKWRSEGWFLETWTLTAGPTVEIGSGATSALCRGLVGAARDEHYRRVSYNTAFKTGCAALYHFDNRSRARGGVDALWIDGAGWQPVVSFGVEVGFGQ